MIAWYNPRIPGLPLVVFNVSCSRVQPWGCFRARDMFRTPGPSSKNATSPSPVDLGAIREFGGCTKQSGLQDTTERLHQSTPNMTGRPGCRTMEMNEGSSVSYLARTPCVPLFCTCFNRGGNRRALTLRGEGGDHFHCAVEPPTGHIRC